MAIELVKEKCAGAINTVEIGTERTGIVRIGGQTGMPFLFDEGAMPNPPLVAFDILDCAPRDWPEQITRLYGDALSDPVKWARACVEKFEARILHVRLQSVHPDWLGRPSEHAVDTLKKIAESAKVPLIITGSGDVDRDNDLLPKASQALKGYNCLFGSATQNDYKTITATCLADGHCLIAESPIDVNIAKQVNILTSDMGFDPAKIVMHPTTTSLGYGMEYVYSIMERARLAAFIGDRMLAMPFILFVGEEVWKTKEAKDSRQDGANWELATAVSLFQAGADIVVMRHPGAAVSASKFISTLMGGGKKC